MKVDGNNPVDGKRLFDRIQDTTKDKGIEKREDANKSESESDKVSLSGKAKEINDLKAYIDGLPDIRRDKVDAVKKAIDTGTYNFDSLQIAQRMIEEM